MSQYPGEEYTDEDTYDYDRAHDAAEGRFTKKHKIIAAVVAAVLAITAGALFFFKSGDEGDVNATGDYSPMDILIASQDEESGGDTPGRVDPESIPTPTLEVSAPNPQLVPEGTSQQNLVAPNVAEAPADMDPSTPVSITVSDGGTDKTAQITPVGTIGPDNAATLAPPEDISKIGWYNASAMPGADDDGTIVMTGHVNYDGVIGFASLFTHMKAGSIVTVTTEDGNVHTYKVRQDVVEVPKTLDEEYVALTEDTLQRASGPEALVLLTCGGAFDPNSPLGYQSNMLVVADPV